MKPLGKQGEEEKLQGEAECGSPTSPSPSSFPGPGTPDPNKQIEWLLTVLDRGGRGEDLFPHHPLQLRVHLPKLEMIENYVRPFWGRETKLNFF